MNKLKRIIITVVLIIIVLLFIELTIPAAKGLTFGILHIFIPTIKEFYIKDWIWSVVLFFMGAFLLYGTVHISKNAENKLWAVVTGVVSLASFISMFAAAPGGV